MSMNDPNSIQATQSPKSTQSPLAYASFAGVVILLFGAMLMFSVRSMNIKFGATIMAVGLFMALANPAIRPPDVSETHWFLTMTAMFGFVTWGAMNL